MTRARTLADMISDGVIGTTELADDVITPVKLDETGNYTMAQLSVDGVAQIRGVTVKDSGGTTKGYVQGDGDGLLIASDGSNNITFDLNAVERMRITASGNVGIQNNNPNHPLEIANGHLWVRQDSGNSSGRGIQFGLVGNHGSYRSAIRGGPENYGGTDSGILTFHTQDGYAVSDTPPERMRIDSSGNLILNHSPTSTSDNIALRIKGGTSGYSNVQFADADDVNVGMIQYNHGSNYMQFTANDSERMRITNIGFVGIGIASPRQLLHVNQTTASSDAIVRITNTNTPSTGGHRVEFADGTGTSEGSTVFRYGYIAGERSSGANDGHLILGTKPDNSGSPREHLRVSSSGELTITGTYNGNARDDAYLTFGIKNSNGDLKKAQIHAIKTADISSELIFSTTRSHAFGERMRLDDGGNLGIGTTAPSSYAKNTGIAIRGGNQAGVSTYAGQDASDTTAFLNMYADQNQSYQRFFDVGAVGASSGQGSNMRFLTQPSGGTPRVHMQIDRDGRVTMPYQPAFVASSSTSGSQTIASQTVMTTFNSTSINRGNCWSTSNNRFTAPVDGLYIFTACIGSQGTSETSAIWIAFKKNGGFVITGSDTDLAAGTDGDGDFQTITLTQIISLSANDYVQLSTRNAGGVYSKHHSHILGYLLG